MEPELRAKANKAKKRLIHKLKFLRQMIYDRPSSQLQGWHVVSCCCLFCLGSIAFPLLYVGMHQINMVSLTSGNLTFKSYDIFNYTADDAVCNPAPPTPPPPPEIPQLSIAEKSKSLALYTTVSRVSAVPVVHYHLYYEIRYLYRDVLHVHNACAPSPGVLRALCSDGSSYDLPQPGSKGPTTCDRYVAWSLDTYETIPLQDNRPLWVSETPSLLYGYIEDPGLYGWKKIYGALPFFVGFLFLLVALCNCSLKKLIENMRTEERSLLLSEGRT